MSNILIRMTEVKDLSPSERHVVDYVLENSVEACRMGVVELGERSFTSATTVKRLCRKLGVGSYTEFRMQLSAAQGSLTREGLLRGVGPVERFDNAGEVLDKISRQNAATLLESGQVVDTQVMRQVVEYMAKADRINFYAVGAAVCVAQDAQQKCLRLKIRSDFWNDRVSMFMSAKSTGRDSVVFLISREGEDEGLIQAARELTRREAVTVAMTRRADSLLARACQLTLEVYAGDDPGGMYGCISSLSLMEALFVALINTDYERYMKNLEDTNLREIDTLE